MTHPVERSLELAAERGGDITSAVYARLFAAYPQTEAMFWRDQDGSIRGEMLARVIEALLDFAGERLYSASLIRCEVVRHDNELESPPDLFGRFFEVVAATVRESIGPEWTPAVDEAWSDLLAELDYYVRHPDQHETAATRALGRA
jgi:hemoglobin-like flavoprotein